MSPPLPSLRALHAYALVSRHGSNAAAGRELGVSSSAISHLLRELERQVGMTLLEHEGGRRVLTADGVALAAEILPAFEAITSAAGRVRRGSDRVRLSTVASFAELWLAPRLGRFREREPALDLHVAATTRLVDLDREDTDLAIRWGEGHWPGLEADLLFRERLIAVSRPDVVARAAGANGPPRIVARRRHEDWALWAAAAGLSSPSPHGPLIEAENRSLAVRIALGGGGLLVIDEHLVAGEIEQGRLIQVRPDVAVQRPGAYWIVRGSGRALRPAARRLRDWLIAEAGPS